MLNLDLLGNKDNLRRNLGMLGCGKFAIDSPRLRYADRPSLLRKEGENISLSQNPSFRLLREGGQA
jgi:hypothetical protein